MADAMRYPRTEDNRPSREQGNRNGDKRNGDRHGRDKSREPRGPPSQFTNYTPLLVPREIVLAECAASNFKNAGIRFPKSTPFKPGQDRSRYCAYHKSYGHLTEDCIQLKDAIKILIRNGKLKDYVKRKENPRQEKKREDTPEDEPRASGEKNVALAVWRPEDFYVPKRLKDTYEYPILNEWENFAETMVISGGVFDKHTVGSVKRKFEELITASSGMAVTLGKPKTSSQPLSFYIEELPGGSANSKIPILVRADMANFDSSFQAGHKEEKKMRKDKAEEDAASRDNLRPIPDRDFELIPLGEDPSRNLKIGKDVPDLARKRLLTVDEAASAVVQRRRRQSPEKVEAAEKAVKDLLEANFISEAKVQSNPNGCGRQDENGLHDRVGQLYYYNVMPFGLKNAGATYQRMMNKVFRGEIGDMLEVYMDDMIVKSHEEVDHTIHLRKVFEQARKVNMRFNPEKCTFGIRAGKFLGFYLTERGIEANPDKLRAFTEFPTPNNKKSIQTLNGMLTALSRFVAKSAQHALPLFKLLRKESAFEWTEECEQALQHWKEALSEPPVLSRPDVGEVLYLYLAVASEAVSATLIRETLEGHKPVYFTSKALQGPELRYQRIEKVALALVTAARRLRYYFLAHMVVVRTDQPIKSLLVRPDMAGRMLKWSLELSEFDIRYESRKALKAQALQHWKEALSEPPVLSRPDVGEVLYLYLAVASEAVSATLIRETLEGQKPVYFTSKALQGPELRYQMLKWSLELSEFDIRYESRKALKAQVLADFVAEMSCSPSSTDGANKWTIFVDGASNATGAGAGIILENEEGILIEVSLALSFPTSNNQAEYEVFLAGLRLAEDVGAKEIKIYTDSQLVASQVLGEYQAKNDNLFEYLALVKERITKFDSVEIQHVPREHNKRADILSKLASTKRKNGNKSVIQEILSHPSIQKPTMVLDINAIGDANCWMTPVYNYLAHGTLPNDEKEAATVKRRACSYTLLDDKLYRRGFSIPLLKCADEAIAEYILREIHEGINSQHLEVRSLARRALRAGYYWPTMQQDAKEHVKKCDKCQRHGDMHLAPPHEIKSLSSPWPFAWWGMDILDPFTRGNLQCKYLIVGVDYFTKWVEAEPLPEITSFRILRFFKRDILCRFGIPQTVVTDNGTQFTDRTFRGFLAKINTKHHFTSVEHPQTNGQAEAANRVILRGLRRRLGDAKKQWVEELPHVLWAYRTTPHSTTGETPFRLAYGTEAVIPVEIGEPSRRTEAPLDEEMNDEAMREELDLVEEIRTSASLKEASLKQRVAARHDTKVIKRDFEVGSLVLRRNAKDSHEGKLAANWEEPYRVRGKTDNGAYHLETLQGKEIPRTWNAQKYTLSSTHEQSLCPTRTTHETSSIVVVPQPNTQLAMGCSGRRPSTSTCSDLRWSRKTTLDA
ncbi:hypothetical protein TSUD_314410 [Trifolium subterraneum]|uniref:Uncharacterized protein n=1 Tax=Trifolium subterraneum TaxID=3900 RepID=A0A2Z6M278_TRISU|nr:hypothetical protein TSUD_314410 [Trifolium subterraneum]